MGARSSALKPGVLEVFCGPMKSGKSKELIMRADKLRFMDECKFIYFKPDVDTRDPKIQSRFGDFTYECIFINHKRPQTMLEFIDDEHKMVLIDEAQFFSKGISSTILRLLQRNMNVIVAGLDLDFRGEPFGQMPKILSMADDIVKLTAVCDHPGCNELASRTQRLVDGKAARFDSPIILVGDEQEGYESRCLQHHDVPGKL